MVIIAFNSIARKIRLRKVRWIFQAHTANSSNARPRAMLLTPPAPPPTLGLVLNPTHHFSGRKKASHVQALPCLASVRPVQGKGDDPARTSTSLRGVLSASLSPAFSLCWRKSGRNSPFREMALLFLTLQHPPIGNSHKQSNSI